MRRRNTRERVKIKSRPRVGPFVIELFKPEIKLGILLKDKA